MDDPRAERIIFFWMELFTMVKKGIGKGSCIGSWRWMDYHIGWFVNGDEMFILIKDIQGNRLWLDIELRRSLKKNFNSIANLWAELFFHRLAIELHMLVFDELLKIGT